MEGPDDTTLHQFEAALAALDTHPYELTLFVTGASDLSARAITNVQRLCDQYLAGRYKLKVVDLFDDPDAVRRAGVLASPTLVKHQPLPIKRLVGDLSQTDQVLSALQIHRAPPMLA